MSRSARLRWTLALTASVWLAVLPAAHAYVDPGTTGFIFSWIVAAIAAVGMTLRIFWSRVRRFFGRDRVEDGPDGDAGLADAASAGDSRHEVTTGSE